MNNDLLNEFLKKSYQEKKYQICLLLEKNIMENKKISNLYKFIIDDEDQDLPVSFFDKLFINYLLLNKKKQENICYILKKQEKINDILNNLIYN